MPAPATAEAYLDLVRKSSLVESARLDAFVQSLREGAGLPADVKELARLFVEEGLLTNFQTEQLLRGKHRGYSLGKYLILERLGTGGMGTVFLAEHLVMRHRVALKVLPPSRAQDVSLLERFHREARAAATLHHPNLVRAHDIDQEGNLHFLVMDYVEGVDLQTLVTRGGPLTPERAANYIRQAAVGLHYVHEAAGLVHRDIKPGNLVVDRSGTIRLLDMGLARFFRDEKDTLTQNFDDRSVLGTADYLAPEQAINSHEVDIRADLYSLGATFYFLLSGRAPFQDGTVAQKLIWHQTRDPMPIRERCPDVPEGMAAVVAKLMAKSAGDRYQTPAEVVAALEPWTQSPIAAPSEEEVPRLCRAAQRVGSPPSQLAPWSSPASSASWTLPPHAITANPPSDPARSGVTAPDSSNVVNTIVRQAAGAGATQVMPASQEPSSLPPSVMPAKRPSRSGLKWFAAILLFSVGVPLAWLYGPRLYEGKAPELRVAQEPVASPKPAEPTKPPPAPPAADLKAPPKPPTKQPPSRPPAPPIAFVRVAGGKEQGFATVREAVAKAAPGDRVQVRAETVEELLALNGLENGSGKGVTLEAAAPSGQPVTWRGSASGSQSQPLLTLSSVPGLRVRGFVFDGGGRIADLLLLTGRSSGLVIEDCQFRNFWHSAITLRNCAGSEADPLRLNGCRVLTSPPRGSEGALIFDAMPGHAPITNAHVQVWDCRFEGPCRSALLVGAPVNAIDVQHNRFFQGTDGILVKKADPPLRVQLTVHGNTFHDVERVLHFDGLPTADGHNRITLRNNLFSKVRTRLVQAEGVRLEPDTVTADWIWFNEGDPSKEAPQGKRYFRKTFELPASADAAPTPRTLPTRARLELWCDDAYKAWVNGKQVGQGRAVHSRRLVAIHEVAAHLRAGRNVLAVEGTNERLGAGLMAQLTCEYQPSAGEPSPPKPLVLVSDRTWVSAREAPAGWEKPTFDDTRWLAPWTGGVNRVRGTFVWSSVLRSQFPGRLPDEVLVAGQNIAERTLPPSYPYPEARTQGFTLGADLNDDVGFLRPPTDLPVSQMNPERGPVGLPRLPPALAVVLRIPDGKEQKFATVREALRWAQGGDRVHVRAERLEEQLLLDGPGRWTGEVVVVGESPAGGPVTWVPPSGLKLGQPLVSLDGVAGLRLQRFVLDGQGRIDDLVRLSGRCQGLAMEDVELRGFRREGVVFWQCRGIAKQPVRLQRVRAVGSKDSAALVAFDSPLGSEGCSQVQVQDSRLEGPAGSAVALRGPVADVVLTRSRLFDMPAGIRYVRTPVPPALGMELSSCTFAKVKTGLLFESIPPIDARIVTRNNLFALGTEVARVEGFTPRRTTPAAWIWADEGRTDRTAPAADRWFRSRFELPAQLPTRATLDIACDDSFVVWLNGAQIGQGDYSYSLRRVLHFDVVKHLRPGVNVLAVRGTNKTGPQGRLTAGGLLVHLEYALQGGSPGTVVSDASWKTSAQEPEGWLAPDFDDRAWQPVRVLAPYGQGERHWQMPFWDSLVRDAFEGKTDPIVAVADGNARDYATQDGFPNLRARGVPTVTLGLDPTKDAEFLYYAPGGPLSQAGSGKKPVGAPAP